MRSSYFVFLGSSGSLSSSGSFCCGEVPDNSVWHLEHIIIVVPSTGCQLCSQSVVSGVGGLEDFVTSYSGPPMYIYAGFFVPSLRGNIGPADIITSVWSFPSFPSGREGGDIIPVV